ncbi:MAG: rhodanese-like domain-containing protein [Nitriliruptoraceae bacterium]|nr:rhodanese-like domain-containing protein [Nitriliruptoraceae bacterium]
MNQTTSCVVPAELTGDLRSYELVDVRTPGEFESARLPHSHNRPLDQLDQHVGDLRELQEQGRPLVLVCQSGNRATQAQATLREHGVQADVLTGGVEGWRNEGRDVVVDVARWDMNRQVRGLAGAIVLTSVIVATFWTPAMYVAGAIGAGLVFSAVTNTCGMAMMLAKLPYNRPRGG